VETHTTHTHTHTHTHIIFFKTKAHTTHGDDDGERD
jgi:hypothetical protein